MTVNVSSALVRAAERLEHASSSIQQGFDIDVPRFFGRRAARERRSVAYALGIEQARRGLAELEGIRAVDDDTRAGIAAVVGVVDDQRASGYRNSWFPLFHVPRQLAGRAQGLRLHAELAAEGADPAVVRSRLRDEVEQLALRPYEELSHADLARVGHISMLPRELRPELPGTLNSGWERSRFAIDTLHDLNIADHARREFDHIRLDVAARELAADSTVTREALEAEVRAIVSKPDADITLADSERLSLIARLPAGRRPELIDRAKEWSVVPITNFSSWGYVPAKEGGMRMVLDSMRRAVLEDELLADPTLTKERVAADFLSLMVRPAALLSPSELVRVSALAGLPEHLRPSLPAEMAQSAMLGEAGTVLRPNGTPQLRTFADVRHHLAEQDPVAMARELVRQDRTGSAIDLELVSVLAKRPGVLDMVGIDGEFLHRQSITALANAGGDRTADLASNLRIARDVVERHPATDANVATVRAEALELAERNLARMDGTRRDTYARHPDYAEVGRFASIATLLHQMRELTAATATAAESTGERLAW
jgi:hypothetical protein